METLSLDIQEQLEDEGCSNQGNLRSAVQRALNVGQSLGILSLSNEIVRVPFNFRAEGRTGRPAPDALNLVNGLTMSPTPFMAESPPNATDNLRSNAASPIAPPTQTTNYKHQAPSTPVPAPGHQFGAMLQKAAPPPPPERRVRYSYNLNCIQLASA